MKAVVVLDTNVFVSALRSQLGASYKLLSLVGGDTFDIVVSVPLVLEYEEVARRQARRMGLTYDDINAILDYVCTAADRRKIFFLWRPFLPDPSDDMVLELAVEAACDYVVTFNVRHFIGTEQFGISVITPGEFLKLIGVNK
ncbi:MAG: putative toxin-antitoxin system toxin component, PIN family [Acidobacteriota bacterium]